MGSWEPEETKVSPVCSVGRTLVCHDSALLCNWTSLLEIEGDFALSEEDQTEQHLQWGSSRLCPQGDWQPQKYTHILVCQVLRQNHFSQVAFRNLTFAVWLCIIWFYISSPEKFSIYLLLWINLKDSLADQLTPFILRLGSRLKPLVQCLSPFFIVFSEIS